MSRLTLDNSLLAIVDVQGKLAHLVCDKEILHMNLQRLIQCASILKIPICWVEQNPRGLGATIPEIAELLTAESPIPKMTFSAFKSDTFVNKLAAYNRKQILLAGIETHVCIYQTASDLLEKGYQVHVVVDAVSSRLSSNKQIGLARMKMEGAIMSSTEMAIFELLGTAEHPCFKAIVKILK
jgi:nicotinamidase-related amidase